jgi:hypothetical protein
MTTYIIPPTYLYIKQHSITGLKYFGKTIKDPLKYNGSGVYWTNHIKKHGRKHIITTWVSEPYIDSDAIVEYALTFSRDNNIVESKLWANMEPENGLNGGSAGKPAWNKGKPSPKKGIPIGPHSAETRQKMSDARKGMKLGPHSDESKQKISDANKGKPSPKKGIPTGKKGVPNGKQKNPAPKVECPHCGLVGRISNMTRHHFDNCKEKPFLTLKDTPTAIHSLLQI